MKKRVVYVISAIGESIEVWREDNHIVLRIGGVRHFLERDEANALCVAIGDA